MDNDNKFYDAVALPLGPSKILGMKPALFELVRFDFSTKMVWWLTYSKLTLFSISFSPTWVSHSCMLPMATLPFSFAWMQTTPQHIFPERCLLPFLSSTVHAQFQSTQETDNYQCMLELVNNFGSAEIMSFEEQRILIQKQLFSFEERKTL